MELMFKKTQPKVSVCIPVCGTEKYLAECLESVAAQDFDGTEILIVDDSGKTGEAEKIAKEFRRKSKKRKISVKFIAHAENKGLVEARRTAVYEASGDFIMFLDNDDVLPANAIKTLFATAERTKADIVHGKANVCFKEGSVQVEFASQASRDSSPQMGVSALRSEPQGKCFPPQIKKRFEVMREKAEKVFVGELFGRQIFDGFLTEVNHSAFLWGKIFTRELCLEAFSRIPPVYCAFGEDFLTYFFLSILARKYAGIEEKVYNYFADTGISSTRKIDSLEEWRKVCSTAGVFTVLLSWIEENAGEISEEEADKVREMCRWYAANNLVQLENAVVPELQEEARRMLCDYWGEKMINDKSQYKKDCL